MISYKANTTLLAALAVIGGLAMATPAWANAGHYNVTKPSVSDGGGVRAERNAEAEPCYTEPTGAHKQIRWDDACRATKERQRSAHEHPAGSEPSKYVPPAGFHHQVEPR